MEGDGGGLLVPVAPREQAREHNVRRGQLLQDGLHHRHIPQPNLRAHRLHVLQLQGPNGQDFLTKMPYQQREAHSRCMYDPVLHMQQNFKV